MVFGHKRPFKGYRFIKVLKTSLVHTLPRYPLRVLLSIEELSTVYRRAILSNRRFSTNGKFLQVIRFIKKTYRRFSISGIYFEDIGAIAEQCRVFWPIEDVQKLL